MKSNKKARILSSVQWRKVKQKQYEKFFNIFNMKRRIFHIEIDFAKFFSDEFSRFCNSWKGKINEKLLQAMKILIFLNIYFSLKRSFIRAFKISATTSIPSHLFYLIFLQFRISFKHSNCCRIKRKLLCFFLPQKLNEREEWDGGK